MKGINIPVLLLCSALVLGILISPWIDFTPSLLGVLFFSFFLLGGLTHYFFRRKKAILPTILIFLGFLSLGLFVAKKQLPKNQQSHYLNQDNAAEEHAVMLNIREVLKPNRFSNRYIATIKSLDGQQASGKVLLSIPRDSTFPTSFNGQILSVDSRIFTETNIDGLPKPQAPYAFDYGKYLMGIGVFGQINPNASGLLVLEKQKTSLTGFAAQIRNELKQHLGRQNFKEDEWGVVNALLLGQRQELSAQVSKSYADAGVIHILAISGLHVGIVLFLLRACLKPLGNQKRIRLLRTIICILGIWAFAILAGLSPSVLRAATMFSFFQIGSHVNHKNGGINGLIISAFLLLLLDPKLLYQVGFQLSYFAVFFILWLQPNVFELWQPESKILRYYWALITVTFTAQLGVLPLSLFYFHQFPGLFLVSNLVVLPLLSVLLGFGLFILILAGFNILPDFLAKAYGSSIGLLNDFIAWVSGFQGLVMKNIAMSLGLVLASYLLILSLGYFLRKPTSKGLIAIHVCLLSLMLTIMIEGHKSENGLFILQKSRSSMIVAKSENSLDLFTSSEIKPDDLTYLTEGFKNRFDIKNITVHTSQNYYKTENKSLLVVDSLGIYDVPDLNPDYILLTQSPRINLERLIDQFPSVEIIADGSNYKSAVERWKYTCIKKGIFFYSTYEMGFLELKGIMD